MKRLLYVFILIVASTVTSTWATESKPVWKWVSANEYYFLLPGPQHLHLREAGMTKSVESWGVGFRAVGNEAFSKTGGLQLQILKVDTPSTGRNTIYLLDLLLGMEYMTPKTYGKPVRYTASVLADLGLCDTTMYAAPLISAGIVYTTEEYADTPTGFTFDIYYRPTDIDLDNVGGGKAGTLRPEIGFKLGYIFEGFWTAKEKAKD